MRRHPLWNSFYFLVLHQWAFSPISSNMRNNQAILMTLGLLWMLRPLWRDRRKASPILLPSLFHILQAIWFCIQKIGVCAHICVWVHTPRYSASRGGCWVSCSTTLCLFLLRQGPYWTWGLPCWLAWMTGNQPVCSSLKPSILEL